MCKEEKVIGLGTYLNAYGTKHIAMRQQVQTKWCLNIFFKHGVIPVLCCPEDRCCVVCPRNVCGIHDMNCHCVHNVNCQYVHLAPMNYPKHAKKCLHLLWHMKCGYGTLMSTSMTTKLHTLNCCVPVRLTVQC